MAIEDDYEKYVARDVFGFNIPKPGKWKCYMYGTFGKQGAMVWVPAEGAEPNWFWRQMQYLILGNKWVKGD